MINNDYQAVLAARHHLDQLHAEADQVRLLNNYRALHPELRLRVRVAGWLRRLADRLAAPDNAPVAEVLPSTRRARA